MTIQVIIKTSPTAEDVDGFIKLLRESYLNVPLTTAFVTEIDSASSSSSSSSSPYAPPPPSVVVIDPARLRAHFSLGIPLACKSSVLLSMARSACSSADNNNNTAVLVAAALIEPPSFVGVPASQARKNPGPVLAEYRALMRQLKAKYLGLPDTGPRSWDQPAAPSQSSGGPSEDPYPADFNKDTDFETRPFYHLALVARNVGAAGEEEIERAVDAVVKPILDRAEQEGVPVWTEASTGASRAERERWGFRVAEEVAVGKGRVGANGLPKQGGEGVRVWAMILDNHLA
ncbi:hypothetical protein DV738_g3620, partial [Chaetothyriales sp. CBS 135597]